MSTVSGLNKFYGNFFKNSGYFSVSPYILGFTAAAGIYRPNTSQEANQRCKDGLLACIALTVIPVLPTLTAITLSLALIGSVIAALSAIIAYPIAAGLDYAIPDEMNYR